MRLGNLGLFFIVAASAVFYVSATIQTYEWLKGDSDTELKFKIGANTHVLKCKNKADRDKIAKVLTGRDAKLDEIELNEAPAAGLHDAEITFADANQLKFKVDDKKLTITHKKLEKLVNLTVDTNKGVVMNKDNKIKFGDVELDEDGTEENLRKLIKYVPQQSEHTSTGAGGDAWVTAKGDGVCRGFDFYVVREGTTIHVLAVATTGVGNRGLWVTAFLLGAFFIIAPIFHFLLHLVDPDGTDAGLQTASFIPQSLKDKLVTEQVDDEDEIDVITTETGEQIVVDKKGKVVGPRQDKVAAKGHDQEIGTAEVTMAALFLLPFLL